MNILEYEKSIAEIDRDLEKLRAIADDPKNPQNTRELPQQIESLARHRTSVLQNIFAQLTPWDKVLLSRHAQRPYTLDYIGNICDHFQELHGDRLYSDDGAIVSGLASLDGRRVAIIGHQKGRDIKERMHRNFGNARPEGYRKALRVMKLACKFGLPIITLVDTPGAAADVAADERGISAALAWNMFEMTTMPVPIVAAVIGEGGSGGALGIAVANRVVMLEHAIYSVIAPEGCATILWRDIEKKTDAAKHLNLTAQGAVSLGIVDEIVQEPLGGAHRDWHGAADFLKLALVRHIDELSKMSPTELVDDRYRKFRSMGQYVEELPGAMHGVETNG